MRFPILILALTFSGGAQEHKVGVNRYTLPSYPPIARQAKVEGDVIAKFSLDRQGNATEVVILSGHPMLKQVVLDAAKNWRFICLDCNYGEYLSTWQVTFHFQVSEPEGDRREVYDLRFPHTVVIKTTTVLPMYVSTPRLRASRVNHLN
jgi:TonB family protein